MTQKSHSRIEESSRKASVGITTHAIALVIALLSLINETKAAGPEAIAFANETTDTTRINGWLESAAGYQAKEPGEYVALFARMMEGLPYKANTLETTPEQLSINTSEVDCTTMMESALALALTRAERRSSWRDYAFHLEQVRYRSGRVNGYGSRLHYMSDWIADNVHRGLVEDVTRLAGNAQYQVKTIDFMSTNRSKYPSLSDNDSYQAIIDVERGYKSHRFPYIKNSALGSVRFHKGDIVMFVTKTKGLDVSHVGIIDMVDGKPVLIHASSAKGKVVADAQPISEYVRRNPSIIGIRVIRMKY